jgi:autotransporter-associated beta strand protein
MNMREQVRVLIKRSVALVAAVALSNGFVHAAEMITPVAATAQSYFAYDNRAPVTAIDGSGMTPNSPVAGNSTAGVSTRDSMWLSDGTRDTWITFDLGSVQKLNGFRLWNYNEAGTFSQRGIKTAGIYVGTNMLANGTSYASAGAAWGTLAENMTFAQASGTEGDPGAAYAFANTVTGRYIQVYVTANYNNDTSYTGISEIRFYAETARSAGDQFTSPAAATAQGYYTPDNRAPFTVINGAGMTPGAPVRINSTAGNVPAGAMWLNNTTNKTWITFDLGTVQTVTGFRLWNYNEHSGIPEHFTKSGVKSASLYVGNALPPDGMAYTSAGSAWGRWIQDFRFCQGNGSAALAGADYPLAAPVTGRYIQFYITDSFGDNAAGLSEIGFYTSTRYAAVSPVAVTAESYYSYDNRAPITAINGAGMTPNNPVTLASLAGTAPRDSMWLSNGNTNTWITFDLGTEQSIAGFHLWNYNEYADIGMKNFHERGIKDAGVYIGDSLPADGMPYANAGPAWGTLVTSMTLQPAPGLTTYAGETYTLSAPVTSRYVQIYAAGNFRASGIPDPYTGISEIMFYTAMRDLTRLSSGDKVIHDSTAGSCRVIEGTGEVGVITLGVADTAINTLYIAATEAPVIVDPAGQTLAVNNIELQADAGGLTLGTGSANGTLKSAGARLRVDNQSTNPVTIHSAIADAGSARSLIKSGRGALVLDGDNTYSGSTTVNGSALRITGGSLANAAINLNAGTLQVTGGASVTAGQFALNMGSESFLSLDGGTLAAGTGAVAADWIGAGNSVLIAESGAVIDTANGSVAINRPLLREGSSSGGLTKTGANTLTLTAPCTYAGATVVQGGTLKLAPPAPLIHYDFDTANISGTTVLNLGTGGAAYNGVINGTPATGVTGVAGEAVTISITGQGVVTANSVSLVNGFTFAAWVKSSGSTTTFQRIIHNFFVDGAYLGTDNNNSFLSIIKNRFYLSTQASDDTVNWHHVALTWDASKQILYYDGAPIKSDMLTGVNAAYASKIGFGNNPVPNSEFWNGSLDEAYVFDRALTAAEISDLKDLSWAGVTPLPATTDLTLNNGATLELSGVSQTVETLTLNGVLKSHGDCTWGAPGSGAQYTSSQFTGTGLLHVLGPPAQGTVILIR